MGDHECGGTVHGAAPRGKGSAIRAILGHWRARAQHIAKCKIAPGTRSLNCADSGTTQIEPQKLRDDAFCA
eukprot:10967894-Alexandrium_andersonii.AAC.1